MFDIFAKLLSSIASFLFPLFASYKALKTSDPSQLTPWLMYWVVLACALLVESWTEWFLVWIPLYPFVRLLFLLYLVLPQTQGARIIYTTYVHPYLEDNESQIEHLIATTHDKMKAAGMAYLKHAIELLRTQVLGLAPSPEAAYADADANNNSSNIPASQRPRGYTQALLDRFQLPAARWLPAGSKPPAVGADFYNFLASAVTAATGATTTSSSNNNTSNSSNGGDGSAVAPGVGAFPAGDLTASGTLVPPSIRDNADKMTFLAAQRERLNMVLSALDREAAYLRSSGAATAAAAASSSPAEGDNNNINNINSSSSSSSLGGLLTPDSSSSPTERPTTSASAKSGLSKSRSEADFEKIEAESGAEEDLQETARPAPARSGSWLPWGWSTAAKGEGEVEENKTKAE